MTKTYDITSLRMLLLLACMFPLSCARNEQKAQTPGMSPPDTISPAEVKRYDPANQAKIDSLLDKLNDWFKDELDVYERPEAYPNRISSGETNGWVMDKKEQLAELGAEVIWNKEKMQYELMDMKDNEKLRLLLKIENVLPIGWGHKFRCEVLEVREGKMPEMEGNFIMSQGVGGKWPLTGEGALSIGKKYLIEFMKTGVRSKQPYIPGGTNGFMDAGRMIWEIQSIEAAD